MFKGSGHLLVLIVQAKNSFLSLVLVLLVIGLLFQQEETNSCKDQEKIVPIQRTVRYIVDWECEPEDQKELVIRHEEKEQELHPNSSPLVPHVWPAVVLSSFLVSSLPPEVKG